MKKNLLIIQWDGPYFLFETMQVLEKSRASLKGFSVTVLATVEAIGNLQGHFHALDYGLTSDASIILNQQFDMSFNLSMNESSWLLHEKVNSKIKIGPHLKDGELVVSDLWSTFLITVKSGPPFLTFHLQDIYKNILGIKAQSQIKAPSNHFREIIFGRFAESFISEAQMLQLQSTIAGAHTQISFKKMQEVDFISDFSHSLYIGPATYEAVKLCEAGARGIFIGRQFQGFNLIPYGSQNFVISTNNEKLEIPRLMGPINSILKRERLDTSTTYSLYQTDIDTFGLFLKNLNAPETSYPFYQCHVVLWNFLLNLLDINLEIASCSKEQIEVLKNNQHAITKLLRLHDYALSSIDTIYLQTKSTSTEAGIIEGHLKNLKEIDEIMAQLAESHPFIRPFLDFYRVRRGQNDGSTLNEKTQNTFITYTEEHHALSALNELFSVTLRKNEASILK